MKGNRRKLNTRILMILVLLLVTVGISAAGVTYSRYQSSTVIDVPFVLKEPASFYVGVPEKDDAAEIGETESGATETEVPETKPSWKLQEDGSYQMTFCISNSKENSEENETESYRLRVAATLGVTTYQSEVPAVSETPLAEQQTQEITNASPEPTALPASEVVLIVTTANGKEREYKGVPEEIKEDSLLYGEMGPGYQYCFYDMEGDELNWTLEGGKYSSHEYTLQVTSVSEPSLLEVIVEETQAQ